MQYIYGIHAVESLLRRNPRAVQRLWVLQGRADRRIAALLALAGSSGVRVSRAPRRDLDELAGGSHQGVVAEVPGTHSTGAEAGNGSEGAVSAAARPGAAQPGAAQPGAAQPGAAQPNLWREADLLQHLVERCGPALILVLDGITDPHNLGACLRSADAAGVDAVVVPKDRSADLNATVRKVACGAAEAVPFVRVTNLSRTLAALKERGVWLYGTAGEARDYVYQHDLTGPVALVMGGEGSGLRRLTRERCDFLVRLPMAGSVSSLNVSVAAGICLFEAVRQRRAAVTA